VLILFSIRIIFSLWWYLPFPFYCNRET